jgi:hypothetical protein
MKSINSRVSYMPVTRCTNYWRAVLALAILTALSACVRSNDRLLDESEAIADPHFAGRFTFTVDKKTENFQIYLKDKIYLIEENGKLVRFATLHPFRPDMYVLQSWTVKPGSGSPPYEYYLTRKSPGGFQVGSKWCSGSAFSVPCFADTRNKLFAELEQQVLAFDDQKSRIDVVRR